MGVHVSNGSFRTSNKGVVRQVFNFSITGGSGAVGTVTQAGANFVSGVTQTATGIYTVQLNQLYPVRLIHATAHAGAPAVTSALALARIDSDSYSASTGTFVVTTCNTSAAAVDPVAGSIIYVEISYVDQTTGIAA